MLVGIILNMSLGQGGLANYKVTVFLEAAQEVLNSEQLPYPRQRFLLREELSVPRDKLLE